MLSLKPFRDKAKGLVDLLNYAVVLEPGVILNKDGSLLAGFYYQGEDIESSTHERRDWISRRVNAVLARMGSGWVVECHANRLPTSAYPDREASAFPDPISSLIEEERRAIAEREGDHFVSEYVITLQYSPPIIAKAKAKDMVWTAETKRESPADRAVKNFKRGLEEFEQGISSAVRIRRMMGRAYEDRFGQSRVRDELVDYLQFCITGELDPIDLTHTMYLDCQLGGRELWTGDTPQLGEHHFRVVSIEGFPSGSSPNMLERLDGLDIPYRWATRAIMLDRQEAVGILKKHQRGWKQKERGFVDLILNRPSPPNLEAVRMVQEIETSIVDANSGHVGYLYYTSVVILTSHDPVVVKQRADAIVKIVRDLGFACRVESTGTLEAWLGSLPGHPFANVRRPLIHTLNLSDLMPLASVWAGKEHNPSHLFPPNSPALLQGATTGSTPFRLNLHVDDVGHTLMFGPTGAGKSVALATIAAQFRRYRNARITAFDKGRSMLVPALAMGGDHYELGTGQESPGLCPLKHIDDPRDAAWAEGWLARCYELQTKSAPTPQQRTAIHNAIELLRKTQHRSLTNFCSTVMDPMIREALTHYTITGVMGKALDSEDDSLANGSFTVFEIEDLMNMQPELALPVLDYLFYRFERSLDGSPALLILDEAWLMLSHPVFKAKIVEWLLVLRKANCAVLMATQSLTQAAQSGIMSMLLESCPTKILLPNEEARKSGGTAYVGPYELYQSIGLNDAQIDLIENGTRKRDYYYVSSAGRRLFQFELGPIALAFLAASDKPSILRVKQLITQHGDQWPYRWLDERRVDYRHFFQETRHAA